MRDLLLVLVLAISFGSGQSVITTNRQQAESYLRFMAQERGCVVNHLDTRAVDGAIVGIAAYDCRPNAEFIKLALAA